LFEKEFEIQRVIQKNDEERLQNFYPPDLIFLQPGKVGARH
jgi:hypothetical protein